MVNMFPDSASVGAPHRRPFLLVFRLIGRPTPVNRKQDFIGRRIDEIEHELPDGRLGKGDRPSKKKDADASCFHGWTLTAIILLWPSRDCKGAVLHSYSARNTSMGSPCSKTTY